MTYAPSPRPTFEAPTPLPYASVTRHLWGDAEAGAVADWIYVSSDRIHQLVYGLPVGGVFRHSREFRTIFGADLVYYVLAGTMLINNPATGEVHRLEVGEAAFFRRDTWHHVWGYGPTALRVLEFFAPPPSQGTSGAYARKQPYLETVTYTQDELLGRWPAARAEAAATRTITPIRAADLLWRMEGTDDQVLVGLLVSTEHLTVGVLELQPGQHTGILSHGGDKSLYVTQGTVNVLLNDRPAPAWFELTPRDGFYFPTGTRHQLHNITDQPARLVFGVAPSYLPALAK